MFELEECLACELVPGDEVHAWWSTVYNEWVDSKWTITKIEDDCIYGKNHIVGVEQIFIATDAPNKLRVVVQATGTGCWNGTCLRCGKQTFTMFSTVEHQGECKI